MSVKSAAGVKNTTELVLPSASTPWGRVEPRNICPRQRFCDCSCRVEGTPRRIGRPQPSSGYKVLKRLLRDGRRGDRVVHLINFPFMSVRCMVLCLARGMEKTEVRSTLLTARAADGSVLRMRMSSTPVLCSCVSAPTCPCPPPMRFTRYFVHTYSLVVFHSCYCCCRHVRSSLIRLQPQIVQYIDLVNADSPENSFSTEGGSAFPWLPAEG